MAKKFNINLLSTSSVSSTLPDLWPIEDCSAYLWLLSTNQVDSMLLFEFDETIRDTSVLLFMKFVHESGVMWQRLAGESVALESKLTDHDNIMKPELTSCTNFHLGTCVSLYAQLIAFLIKIFPTQRQVNCKPHRKFCPFYSVDFLYFPSSNRLRGSTLSLTWCIRVKKAVAWTKPEFSKPFSIET